MVTSTIEKSVSIEGAIGVLHNRVRVGFPPLPTVHRVDYCQVVCADREMRLANWINNTYFSSLVEVYSALGIPPPRYSNLNASAHFWRMSSQLQDAGQGLAVFAEAGGITALIKAAPSLLKSNLPNYQHASTDLTRECDADSGFSTLPSPFSSQRLPINVPPLDASLAILDEEAVGANNHLSNRINKDNSVSTMAVALSVRQLLPPALIWRVMLKMVPQPTLRSMMLRHLQNVVNKGAFPEIVIRSLIEESIEFELCLKREAKIRWAKSIIGEPNNESSTCDLPIYSKYPDAASQFCAAFLEDDPSGILPQPEVWEALDPAIDVDFGRLPEVLMPNLDSESYAAASLPRKPNTEFEQIKTIYNNMSSSTRRLAFLPNKGHPPQLKHPPGSKGHKSHPGNVKHHGSPLKPFVSTSGVTIYRSASPPPYKVLPPPKRTWRTPPRTAVCMVGAARTLTTRLDQSIGLRQRLLAGWGAAVDVFAVFAKPDSVVEQKIVEKSIDAFRPIRWMWYDPRYLEDQLCTDVAAKKGGAHGSGFPHTTERVHAADQVKQWAQCYGMITQHENGEYGGAVTPEQGQGRNVEGLHELSNTTKLLPYDVIIKVRPDDLWFGPMLPFCAFQNGVAYITRQKERFSDQFFILPRILASNVFNMIFDFKARGLVHCHHPKLNLGLSGDENESAVAVNGAMLDAPPIVTLADAAGEFKFEPEFFSSFSRGAKAHKVPVRLLHFPRILSRDGERDDVISKCKRFLWFIPTAQCARLSNAAKKRR